MRTASQLAILVSAIFKLATDIGLKTQVFERMAYEDDPQIGNLNTSGIDWTSAWLAGTLLLIRRRGLTPLGRTP